MATYIYPASTALQQRIPLWLKFFIYEYNSNSVMRSTALSGDGSLPSGILLDSIYVPAPAEFSTFSDAAYNTAINSEETATKADPRATIGMIGNFLPGVGKAIVSGALAVMDTVENVGQAISDFTVGNITSMDMSDTTFQGINKRVYTFRILFGSLTPQDSAAASAICQALQAYQLPTVLGYPLASKVRHPPLWRFGIGSGNNTSVDPDWCGQPQWALMDGCTINKSAFKNSYAMSEGGKLKPLAQSATITFVELEPALRAAGSTQIISRSTALVSGGASGVVAGG